MVFASIPFLFFFLPIALSIYYLAPPAAKNLLLVLTSFVFYFWGSGLQVALIIVSIISNFFATRGIHRAASGTTKKVLVAFAVGINLSFLAYFKYAGFIVENVNPLLAKIGAGQLSPIKNELPLGISFFTFHAISYVIDIYRGAAAIFASFIDYALYILFFPQLIAGPIVRFKDINRQILDRAHSADLFVEGIERFILGLSKKVLIANTLAPLADRAFTTDANAITAGAAWLGVAAYAFQIYFDFSGYSDMAIGLARMFGFTLPENFNYPYAATSITDFWRRWHITLSTWFKDYVYIPLGGNRMSASRTYLNLYIVFFLCGLWHGASWNFVVWGLLHGTLLAAERAKILSVLEQFPVLMRRMYTTLFVLISWVFFRAESLRDALRYVRALLGAGTFEPIELNVPTLLNAEVITCFFIAILLSFPVYPRLRKLIFEPRPAGVLGRPAQISFTVALVLMFAYGAGRLAEQGYNPFIYFRF